MRDQRHTPARAKARRGLMLSVSLMWLIACGGGGATEDAGTDPIDACVPTTCVAEGAECGMVDLGCGVSESCGTCEADELCADNLCEPLPVACTAATWETDCLPLACEEPTGCTDGVCQYAPLDCSSTGVCPQLVCAATPRGDGGFDNACVAKDRPTCGTCPGPDCGVCVGDSCVVAAPMGSFVTGELLEAEAASYKLTGALQADPPHGAKTCITIPGGAVRCISGSIAP